VEQYLKEIRGADAARIAAQLPMASPGRRRSLMASLVHAQAAAVLARPIAAVPRDVGFTELGMDSFASIELLARLEYLFDLELPQTFTFDHPTIDAVTESLMDLSGSVTPSAAPIERTRP
jgi:acyl carrier protein